jgi:cupin superfamily acireductone dioxygenase involved in methionine salvage
LNTEFSEQKTGENGVKTSFEQMVNGEQKYKMIAEDGSYYCRTVASSQGAWQNSHVHVYVTEFYVVQTGWIAYASLGDDQMPSIRVMREGEHIVVQPGVHHNIYMSANSVIHTIKHGKDTSSDWTASPELDRLTQSITEKELVQKNG